MKTPKLPLTVSNLLWRRKRRKEDFPESGTWSGIHILWEHLHGLPWYELWFFYRLHSIWGCLNFEFQQHQLLFLGRMVPRLFSMENLLQLLVILCLNHIKFLGVPPKQLHGIMGNCLHRRMKFWDYFMTLLISFCQGDTMVCSILTKK